MNEQLEPNQIYEGSVISYDAGVGAYAVSVRGITVDCIALTWVMTRFLGLLANVTYPPGTVVKIVYGGDEASVIIGALQCAMLNNTGAEGLTTTTGEEVILEDQAEETPNQRQKNVADLLAGELDLTNLLGVGVRCMTTIAQLTASGLATVEACALNDMVRIVSDTFRHHHAAGDDEIFHQGKHLNVVSHSTSYDHEAWGVLEENDEKVGLNDGDKKVDFEDYQDTGRWRYSYFRGMLGNFVHMFVSDPTVTLGEFDESGAAKRAGKARVQIMNDGTLLAQTITEICIEKVVRVPVPVQKTEANREKAQEDMDRKLLRLWRSFNDAETIVDAAYQLREYARWMNTRHSLSRFIQNTDNWQVDPETDQPEPSWKNKENDVEEENEDIEEYYDSYACMRIMRDGTILHWCGYGSLICMSEGDIRLHAVRDLEFTAARDIIFRGGRDILFLAFRHVDITAIIGGISTKARTWMKHLCELGRILIKSTARPEEDPVKPSFVGQDEEWPEHEMEGDYGVIIDTPLSGVSVLSQDKILLQTRGSNVTEAGEPAPTVYDEANGDIILRTHGRARINLVSDITDVNIAAHRNITHKSRELWTDNNNTLMRVKSRFSIYRGELPENPGGPEPGEELSLLGGLLRVPRIMTTSLDSRDSLRGPKNPITNAARPVQPTSQPEPEEDEPYTPWSSLLSRDDIDEWRNADDEELEPIDYEEWLYPVFEYNEEEKYRESLTEQYIRLDHPDPGEFEAWDPAVGPRLLRRHASVGEDDPLAPENNPVAEGRRFWWQHEGGEDLREPSSKDPSTFDEGPTTYEMFKTTWRRVKL